MGAPDVRPSTEHIDGAAEAAAPSLVPGGRSGDAPRLADGVELVGEYEGSGYKEAPFIARRADGQMIQLPRILYLVASHADGTRTYDELGAAVSEKVGRGLTGEDVRFLAEKKLEPLGILATRDGQRVVSQRSDPLLALRLRTAVVPPRVVRAITTLFRPFFLPPVIVAALAGLVVLDVWLFATHGIAPGLREVLYRPVVLLAALGLIVLSAALHEIGHATACRYGGGEPGAMGVGIYVVWPAFYTDVTDAYRLDRRGRLRTDLGGVYFNVLFMIGLAGVYFATGWEPLLLVIAFQHVEMLHQFLPFLRLDGYYVVSDLVGVPDLFTRIRPILRSMLPWRGADDRVRELKPWVRVAVTAWVLTVVPVLAYVFLMMILHAPRVFATAGDSLGKQAGQLSGAFGEGNPGGVLLAVVQMVILALPLAGMVYTTMRVCHRAGSAAWARCDGMPVARAGLLLAVAAAAGAVLLVWRPDGDYRPIGPGERWTVQEGIASVRRIPTGAPGLAPAEPAPAGEANIVSDSDPGGAEVTDPAEDPIAPAADESPAPSASPSPSPSASASVTPTASQSPSPLPS